MRLFSVSWKVKNTNSSAKDSKHNILVKADDEEKAIEKLKQNNSSTKDRMYDFSIKEIAD